jgi:hypothetical protein
LRCLSFSEEADNARRRTFIGEGFDPRRMRHAMSETLTPSHVEQSIAALSNHSVLPDFFISPLIEKTLSGPSRGDYPRKEQNSYLSSCGRAERAASFFRRRPIRLQRNIGYRPRHQARTHTQISASFLCGDSG